MNDTGTPTLTGERADLLAELAGARFFLRNTTRDLTDKQAGAHPTVSALCLGGLIKHVADTEAAWVRFIEHGATAMTGNGKDWTEWTEKDFARREATFQMQPGETLAGVLESYQAVARRTDELVATLPDLDLSRPLPEAPWYPPNTTWSMRRALIHIIAETVQHAGHADIIRETIDGAKSMG
jgi:uncharacterized damage-inducible protein DinB